MKKYPLAKQGIFRTVQGEGAMLGVPMTFIRFAGCSIGCPACDTDYQVASREFASDIYERVESVTPPRGWVWITGGEPTDHDISPILILLSKRFRIAVATAGHCKFPWPDLADWISVSPHHPGAWRQLDGHEVKLVPGVNGYRLNDFNPTWASAFENRFVMPCDGKSETVQECIDWLEEHRGWKMTVQAHKQWGMQ